MRFERLLRMWWSLLSQQFSLSRYFITVECRAGCSDCINANYCLVCEETNTFGKYCEALKNGCDSDEYLKNGQCDSCSHKYSNCYLCNETNCIVSSYDVGILSWPYTSGKVASNPSTYIKEDGTLGSTPYNCKRLSNFGCLLCNPGYALINHICVFKKGLEYSSPNLGVSLCQIEYYKINMTDCGRCSANCLICTNSSVCDLCEYGYELTPAFDCALIKNDWFYYFKQVYTTYNDVCQINNQPSRSCVSDGKTFYYNGKCQCIYLCSLLRFRLALHQLIVCI
jgi:hypothetical protein